MNTRAVAHNQQNDFAERLTILAETASRLGFEIVDVAGFLDHIEHSSFDQLALLDTVKNRTEQVMGANVSVREAVQAVVDSTDQAMGVVDGTVKNVRQAGDRTQKVASWVSELNARMECVAKTLRDVESNTSGIAKISTQVNILAINAKIEASRAGDAGRGFAVVAEAIADLSRQTDAEAANINDNISRLAEWIKELDRESSEIGREADSVIEEAKQTDTDLSRICEGVSTARDGASRIASEADQVREAIDTFGPAISSILESVNKTANGIKLAHERVENLVDQSERIVQTSVEFGGASSDSPFINRVIEDADRIGKIFSAAVTSGRISMEELFSRDYNPIPGTDPQQYHTSFVDFTDEVLPKIQEAALDFMPEVVFCAAVNPDGFLPTHNLKFAKTPGDDPDWNQANCRNRRIFNDRVGLKSGNNTEQFLLQVYRREMGGGEFVLMKDVSAPIFVKGRHWGGLRLAYRT